ncbi:hypothetical protein ACR6C2_30525 [Streptomyces sp. INA 01156]
MNRASPTPAVPSTAVAPAGSGRRQRAGGDDHEEGDHRTVAAQDERGRHRHGDEHRHQEGARGRGRPRTNGAPATPGPGHRSAGPGETGRRFGSWLDKAMTADAGPGSH